jgi:hypothetical protein
MGNFSNDLGTLKVDGAATLVLGSGLLSFLDSSALDWPGALTLSGTLGPQTVRFGTSRTALTDVQLAKINNNGRPVALDADGYLSQSCEIAVAASGGGSVAPSGTVWVVWGSNLTVAVTAAPYHHVADLLTNGVSIGGPLNVAATNFTWEDIRVSGTLLALFAPNLTTNGVPEWWLAAYGLTNGTWESEALSDGDEDGMRAWMEYVAGTDPRYATSRLDIAEIRPHGTNWTTYLVEDDVLPGVWHTQRLLIVEGFVLDWAAVTNRRYAVYALSAADGVPALITGGLAATPPMNTYTAAAPGILKRFYRLGVTLPAPY